MRRRRSPEPRLVWIFGSPRSGSTWLLNLLAADPGVAKMDEPGIGIHLGVSAEAVIGLPSDQGRPFRALDMRSQSPDYFFADAHRDVWEPRLRDLICARMEVAARGLRWLAIKEPHGGDAADLLMRLLPRSRMVFLLRDGRDVVDSELDAVSAGGWALQRLPGQAPVADRNTYLSGRALTWLRRTEIVQRAYDAHEPALRMLIRYEDLLDDRDEQLARLASWLDLDEPALLAAGRELAIERVADRGPGRFVRAGSPGLWRENLSADEQAVLAEILGPKLRELGYEAAS